MRLYNRYQTYYVLGGLAFLHILILTLCIFFIHRFIIVKYEPGVFFLLAILIFPVIFLDIIDKKQRITERFLIRCKVTAEGMLLYGFCCKKRIIKWNDVRVYGVKYQNSWDKFKVVDYGLMFFSTDPNEKDDSRNYAEINDNRIVFHIRKETWNELSKYMPQKMKERLSNAVTKKVNCFYRCK